MALFKNIYIYNGHKILIFSKTLVETFIILTKIQQEIIVDVYRSSCRVPIILARLLIKLEFSTQTFSFTKRSYIKFHQNPSNGS
jgi:hypothetical protein